MKKYAIKATALAIGALVGGAAVASVDFSVSPFVATTDTYASEIDYSSATGVAITAANTITTKLGFGVSTGQARFIRVDFGGAKLKTAAAVGNVTLPSAGSSTIVASGGAIGDTFVIYQVTSGAGDSASASIVIAVPNLNVTNANAADVTVTYALYETGTAAANAAAGTALATKSGSLFGFASGLKFKLTPANNIATVADGYKAFGGNGNTAIAGIGKFDYDVAAGVFGANGVQVTLPTLTAAGTKIKFVGDFTSAGTTGSLKLGTTAACTVLNNTNFTVAADLLSATFTPGNTASAQYLCLTTDTLKTIAEQTVTADLNPVSTAGATVADPAAATLGTITRDGTTLQAPFSTVHPDYLSRVVLTSTYSADVPVTATVITETGSTCSNASYSATLPKGKQLIINTKDICGTLTGGTRLAVQVVVAAPRNTIQGAYNVMNYDQVTGKTNSLITYVMVAPGTN